MRPARRTPGPQTHRDGGGKERKRRKERKKEARKGKQRGRKGSRDTEMLGGREGKAGQRKASEKMGINYF